MKLNVGCGRDTRSGYVNIDIQPLDTVDVVADAKNLPFPEGVAEEILASDILEHFPWRQTKVVLRRWHRLLKDGGRLFLRTPNLRGLIELYDTRPPGWQRHEGKEKGIDPIVERIFGGQDSPGNFHHVIFDRQALEELLREVGFSVIEIVQDGQDISNLRVQAVKEAGTEKGHDKGRICERHDDCEIVGRFLERGDRTGSTGAYPIAACALDMRFYEHGMLSDEGLLGMCEPLRQLRALTRELRITWEAPTFGPSGYAFASRGYLMGASDLGLRVRSQPLLGDCRMTKIDEEGLDEDWHKIETFVADQYMAFAMKSPVDKQTLTRLIPLTNTPLGGVYVSGYIPTDPEGRDFYQEFRDRNPGMTAYVGYTMFETDRIPEPWVDACNRMDEIWVPCRFNVETFAQSGVARDKLHVIPIGFQPEHYRPERCEPLDSVTRKGFNFLSIFEWTYRKGWDVLIRAYMEEFGEDEDVKLILRSYQGGGVIGENVPPVSEQLTDFITSLGYDPERIPDIELLDRMLPAKDMPRLYKVGDAFVLPTRGEGWGIPLTEAMLMEVPVIATRWSGHLEFMNDDNAYLIDVDRIGPVHPDQVRDNPLYQGQHWAEPSVEHTRALLRHVFENRQEGQEKARLGRRHIVENFTIHHAAARIHQRVAAREVRRIPHLHPMEESGGTKLGGPTPSRSPKASLRVLLQARLDLFTLPGGDTEVVVNLKRSLEGQGVTADFSSNPQLPLDDYDLVHIFNFGTPFAVNASTQKKPYVCTPLYEDVQRYMIRANATAYAFREYLETHGGDALESALNRTVSRGTLKVLPDNRFMIEQADTVFVSGASEAQRIRQDFPNVERTQVLKFGFQRPEDPDAIDADLFRSEFKIRDYVLCVGRLETRKNQLMLLRALQDMDIPLVFVNGNTPQPGYEELCRGFERAGRTLFTGRLSKALLLSAYKGAKVHALPSWYELPGLVSLEAAWMGCNVVASTWGTVGDYLGDHYYPCEPDDPSSIQEAVRRGMRTPYEPAIRQMLEAYTLDNFTRKTIKQYEKVLSTSKTRKAARRFSERAKLAEKELAYQRLKGRALALVDRDPKKAAEEASRLLDFRSDDPTLHCIKGTAAVLLFDYETGESQLKESIDLFPCADIKPYFYLAALLRQGGRHPEAVDVLLAAQRVFVSHPDDLTALLQQHLRSSYAALEGAGTEDQNGLLATRT